MYSKPMKLDSIFYSDLAEHLPLNKVDGRDVFGVEVELEGVGVALPTNKILEYWCGVPDGSLRANLIPNMQAVEYVFRKPYDWATSLRAIKALFDHLNLPEVDIYDSYRTSIHVHVNCLQETLRTLYNYITISIILDELLVSQNGDHRVGNNFCLRIKDAEGPLEGLIASINAYGNIYSYQPNERYSATNFGSLLKFGTIEYRSLECTTDFNRLEHWMGTLQTMKEAARKYENPQHIVGEFSKLGPKGFLMHVLGKYSNKYLNVQRCNEMLFGGMRLAQDFAFCSEWKPMKEGDKEEVSKQKQLLNKKLKPVHPLQMNYEDYIAAMAPQQQQPQIAPPQPIMYNPLLDAFDVPPAPEPPQNNPWANIPWHQYQHFAPQQ